MRSASLHRLAHRAIGLRPPARKRSASPSNSPSAPRSAPSAPAWTTGGTGGEVCFQHRPRRDLACDHLRSLGPPWISCRSSHGWCRRRRRAGFPFRGRQSEMALAARQVRRDAGGADPRPTTDQVRTNWPFCCPGGRLHPRVDRGLPGRRGERGRAAPPVARGPGILGNDRRHPRRDGAPTHRRRRPIAQRNIRHPRLDSRPGALSSAGFGDATAAASAAWRAAASG